MTLKQAIRITDFPYKLSLNLFLFFNRTLNGCFVVYPPAQQLWSYKDVLLNIKMLGPSCSKLTISLVNNSLKFQT